MKILNILVFILQNQYGREMNHCTMMWYWCSTRIVRCVVIQWVLERFWNVSDLSTGVVRV